MGVLKCVINFDECLFSDDMVTHKVAKFQKGMKCADDVFWDIALNGCNVHL